MMANVYWHVRHWFHFRRHPDLHGMCTCRGAGYLGRKPWRRS